MAVEARHRLDRPDDPGDRHHFLAHAPGDRHLTEYRQAVAAGPAGQPPGQPGQPRLPQGALEIIPGVGPGEPGLHGIASWFQDRPGPAGTVLVVAGEVAGAFGQEHWRLGYAPG